MKFIRFAQWRIELTGYGILAFISNNGYLDNPTFRGMRQALLKTFDNIYILDLHGNSKKKERSPDGSADQNVFDIQQGVAIEIFIKHLKSKQEYATVHHAHLWGTRETKYNILSNNDISTTQWTTLAPRSPFYLFTPQDIDLQVEYEQGWKITELMPINGVGITTARDHVVIDYEEIILIERAKQFRDSSATDIDLCQQMDIPLKKGWSVSKARKLIRAETNLRQFVKPIMYRPFDERLIFYHDSLVWRTVKQIMHHMQAGKNLGLSTTRSIEIGRGWEHVFCTSDLIQHHTVSIKEVNYLFPLYLYPENNNEVGLFDLGGITNIPGSRRPNLASEFTTELTKKTTLKFVPDGKGDLYDTFGPEDVFGYIYAIFHSCNYRSRYAAELKKDFPRVPLTSQNSLFRTLCILGNNLVTLHLMEKKLSGTPRFNISGSDAIEAVCYTEQGRVWINKEQYFEGISPEVWNFYIGGYQVCHKWLKDRKGRTLEYDDINHYQQIVAVLAETIRLMAEIDETIIEYGGWPIT